MIEVELTLDFACCLCDGSISATVKCSGKGLATGLRSVAAVNLHCPNCGGCLMLYFEPGGTVREVSPYLGPAPVPQPSLN
jgi:hypothetical protein